MSRNYLHDQRGVAMVLELVLIAAVLSLVGLALYQSNHHGQTASGSPAAKASVGLASSAAAVADEESAADAKLSASAEASGNAVAESDVDVTNLGGSTGANSF